MSKRRNFNRQEIFEQQGKTCTQCGSTYMVEIHHKDFDQSNNSPSNAKVLCIRCHRKIHYHRNLMAANGREIEKWRAYGDFETEWRIPNNEKPAQYRS